MYSPFQGPLEDQTTRSDPIKQRLSPIFKYKHFVLKNPPGPTEKQSDGKATRIILEQDILLDCYLPSFLCISSNHRCLPNTKPIVWMTCCLAPVCKMVLSIDGARTGQRRASAWTSPRNELSPVMMKH